jgi:hypothetical protein
VEEDVAALPIYVGFFGSEGVVFGAHYVAHQVEEFLFPGGGGVHGCLTFPLWSV